MIKMIARSFGLTVLVFFLSSVSFAAEWLEYEHGKFETSQKAGEKILIDVYATWCPVCKAQAIILEDMKASGKLDEVTLFRVNYDTQKNFLKTHRIPRQSTILIFSGKKEVMRSIADTDSERLTSAISKALQ